VTTLFIIDDRESVRNALAQRLSRVPGIHVVGTAGTSQDGINLVRIMRPDVILIELKLADGLGLDALRTIRAENPTTRIIVLTSYLDDFERQVALKLGAERYLLKHIDSQGLAEMILDQNAAPR
jgi:DNA-binding NarL/FixJ family response regulator